MSKKTRNILLGTLIPIGTLAVTAAIVVPCAIQCSKSNNGITVTLTDLSDKSVSIMKYDIVEGKNSTITLRIPEGKEIKDTTLMIDDVTLVKGTDYYVEGNVIHIFGKAVKGKNVKLTVSLQPTSEIKVTLTEESDKDVKIASWNIIHGEDSTITLTIPAGKEILTTELSVDDVELTKDTDFTVEANVIHIKGTKTQGKDYKLTVTLQPIVYQIELTKTSLTLNKGEEDEIKVKTQHPEGATVEWKVEQEDDFISFDSTTGKVTALKKGNASVTATLGTASATCTVEVTEDVPTGELTLQTNLAVCIDKTEGAKLIATIKDSSNAKIHWEIVGGTENAEIDGTTETSSGEPITIKGKHWGEAVVKATYGDQSATCTIDVGYSFDVIVDDNDVVYGNVKNLYGGSGNITAESLSSNDAIDVPRANFNYTVVLSKTTKTINQFCLNNCSTFNKSIILSSNTTKIDYGFLQECKAFNQPLLIPNKTETIDGFFLNGCEAFNLELIIPNSVKSIGTTFMQNCKAFNSELILPNSITSLGNWFMNGCTSFNQAISIPNKLTAIREKFMQSCTSFNKQLDNSGNSKIYR